MPQSHHTPGPRTGCSQAVLNKNRTSTHGARTGPVRRRTNFAFPYGARTIPARGTRGVMRIIQPNHQYTAVSSRTGPLAWCDHENSTDVKFLRALHSALRARNRTGDKNRTGPVVGCDWGIRRGSLLFFKVIRHISRSHGAKNRLWPGLCVSGL